MGDDHFYTISSGQELQRDVEEKTVEHLNSLQRNLEEDSAPIRTICRPVFGKYSAHEHYASGCKMSRCHKNIRTCCPEDHG